MRQWLRPRSAASLHLTSIACILLVLSACQSQEVAPPKYSNEDILDLQRHMQKRAELSGLGTITWKDKNQDVSAPAVLLVAYPDRLRLEVQDPIGGIQALLVVHDEHFWWYASNEKEVLMGRVDRLKARHPLLTHINDWVRAFLAQPDLQNWKSLKRKSKTSLEGLSILGRESLQWSDQNSEPSEWLRKMNNGDEFSVTYERYEARFGVSIPHALKIEQKQNGEVISKISWTWSDVEPRVKTDSNPFGIPQGSSFGRPIKILP